MLHVLTHNILPVFTILALGFIMGRSKAVSAGEAATLNRIAFLVLQPPLIFELLSKLDLAAVRFDAILIYAGCEIVGFSSAYLVARYIFRRAHLEAWLLAMTTIFVNSLLYIWPISVLIYGEEGARPVSAIVALDASIVFAFFIISMELMAGDRATGGSAQRIVRNPVLITIVIALLVNFAAIPIPEPVDTAARFIGAATAPLTLFALGVVLSGHSVVPSPTVIGVSALKLLGFPALLFGGLTLLSPDNPWGELFVLSAAGPSGAMAFALALLYGVRTDAIAPVIIWTSILSVLSLAWLA